MPYGRWQSSAGGRPAGSVVVLFLTQEFVMKRFTSAVQAFSADENGVTGIEYGLIASLIGVAMVSTATVTGTNLKAMFDSVSAKVVAPT
jgi:pilus assembly protein Flp/PilA